MLDGVAQDGLRSFLRAFQENASIIDHELVKEFDVDL